MVRFVDTPQYHDLVKVTNRHSKKIAIIEAIHVLAAFGAIVFLVMYLVEGIVIRGDAMIGESRTPTRFTFLSRPPLPDRIRYGLALGIASVLAISSVLMLIHTIITWYKLRKLRVANQILLNDEEVVIFDRESMEESIQPNSIETAVKTKSDPNLRKTVIIGFGTDDVIEGVGHGFFTKVKDKLFFCTAAHVFRNLDPEGTLYFACRPDEKFIGVSMKHDGLKFYDFQTEHAVDFLAISGIPERLIDLLKVKLVKLKRDNVDRANQLCNLAYGAKVGDTNEFVETRGVLRYIPENKVFGIGLHTASSRRGTSGAPLYSMNTVIGMHIGAMKMPCNGHDALLNRYVDITYIKTLLELITREKTTAEESASFEFLERMFYKTKKSAKAKLIFTPTADWIVVIEDQFGKIYSYDTEDFPKSKLEFLDFISDVQPEDVVWFDESVVPPAPVKNHKQAFVCENVGSSKHVSTSAQTEINTPKINLRYKIVRDFGCNITSTFVQNETIGSEVGSILIDPDYPPEISPTYAQSGNGIVPEMTRATQTEPEPWEESLKPDLMDLAQRMGQTNFELAWTRHIKEVYSQLSETQKLVSVISDMLLAQQKKKVECLIPEDLEMLIRGALHREPPAQFAYLMETMEDVKRQHQELTESNKELCMKVERLEKEKSKDLKAVKEELEQVKTMSSKIQKTLEKPVTEDKFLHDGLEKVKQMSQQVLDKLETPQAAKKAQKVLAQEQPKDETMVVNQQDVQVLPKKRQRNKKPNSSQTVRVKGDHLLEALAVLRQQETANRFSPGEINQQWADLLGYMNKQYQLGVNQSPTSQQVPPSNGHPMEATASTSRFVPMQNCVPMHTPTHVPPPNWNAQPPLPQRTEPIPNSPNGHCQ
ncbi:hypothetical protein 1 [Beihai shrimp virus 5]|uniref:hypothetical protein 1 n=1 Tax=Beihai shrimp virus 5 TaxID=1922671 RepID=UPI000909AA51|nr:hypothetical protein 1 [Beihai shrimp virus 5]APG75677.1 hypothetical protein 1 [Beihai shrimp virus 5]